MKPTIILPKIQLGRALYLHQGFIREEILKSEIFEEPSRSISRLKAGVQEWPSALMQR